MSLWTFQRICEVRNILVKSNPLAGLPLTTSQRRLDNNIGWRHKHCFQNVNSKPLADPNSTGKRSKLPNSSIPDYFDRIGLEPFVYISTSEQLLGFSGVRLISVSISHKAACKKPCKFRLFEFTQLVYRSDKNDWLVV
jgi:hypothetical protein